MIGRRCPRVFVAGAVVMAMLGMARPVMADPPGTQVLNPVPTDRPWVQLRGGSDTGVLYVVHNVDHGRPGRVWVKPAGGPAFSVADDFEALSGSLLLGHTFSPSGIKYRTVADPTTRTCPRAIYSTVIFLPTGWLAHDAADDSYSLTIADRSGCSSRLLTRLPNSRLVAADPTGFLVEMLSKPGEFELRYVPIDDPQRSMTVHSGGRVHGAVSTSSGAVAWAEAADHPDHPPSRLHRWTVSGGAEAVRTVPHFVHKTAVTIDATAYFGCPTIFTAPDCTVGTVRSGGADVSELTGVSDLAGDGAAFYLSRHGDVTTIERGVSVADPDALARLATVPKQPPWTSAIALGASRVAYLDSEGPPPAMLHVRSYTKSGGRLVVGADSRHGAWTSPLSIDGNRQLVRTGTEQTNGKLWLRTTGAPDRLIFAPTSSAVLGDNSELSGTRALWTRADYTHDPCSERGDPPCPQYDRSSAMLYDVRTGVSTRVGDATRTKFALWGPYLVWANRDGSIYRRDLSSGRVLLVKAAGKGVVAVGVWGTYVAWSGCAEPLCRQGVVAYRNLATSTAAVQISTAPVALIVRVTGGHVVYGIPPTYGGTHASVLRELRLGTRVSATIAHFLGVPGTFDADDEVLAWIDLDHHARIAPNSVFADRPKYLGNALGSAAFTPNGDGRGDRWTVEFPVSKALPTCGVTIRRGTVIIRSLGCATSTGSAIASWDGRDSRNRPVPKGRYSWTFNGRDGDGWLLWWNGSDKPITGNVTVA